MRVSREGYRVVPTATPHPAPALAASAPSASCKGNGPWTLRVSGVRAPRRCVATLSGSFSWGTARAFAVIERQLIGRKVYLHKNILIDPRLPAPGRPPLLRSSASHICRSPRLHDGEPHLRVGRLAPARSPRAAAWPRRPAASICKSSRCGCIRPRQGAGRRSASAPEPRAEPAGASRCARPARRKGHALPVGHFEVAAQQAFEVSQQADAGGGGHALRIVVGAFQHCRVPEQVLADLQGALARLAPQLLDRAGQDDGGDGQGDVRARFKCAAQPGSLGAVAGAQVDQLAFRAQPGLHRLGDLAALRPDDGRFVAGKVYPSSSVKASNRHDPSASQTYIGDSSALKRPRPERMSSAGAALGRQPGR